MKPRTNKISNVLKTSTRHCSRSARLISVIRTTHFSIAQPFQVLDLTINNVGIPSSETTERIPTTWNKRFWNLPGTSCIWIRRTTGLCHERGKGREYSRSLSSMGALPTESSITRRTPTIAFSRQCAPGSSRRPNLFTAKREDGL